MTAPLASVSMDLSLDRAMGDEPAATIASMRSTEIAVRTGRRPGLFDITSECERFVTSATSGGGRSGPGLAEDADDGSGAGSGDGSGDGLLTVFVPHATCGIVIMELGAGSETDLMATLERLLPRDDRWRHRHGSPGHGADHVLPLLAPPSITVPVIAGRLALGTWQSIALLDTNADNDTRRVRLTLAD